MNWKIQVVNHFYREKEWNSGCLNKDCIVGSICLAFNFWIESGFLVLSPLSRHVDVKCYRLEINLHVWEIIWINVHYYYKRNWQNQKLVKKNVKYTSNITTDKKLVMALNKFIFLEMNITSFLTISNFMRSVLDYHTKQDELNKGSEPLFGLKYLSSNLSLYFFTLLLFFAIVKKNWVHLMILLIISTTII